MQNINNECLLDEKMRRQLKMEFKINNVCVTYSTKILEIVSCKNDNKKEPYVVATVTACYKHMQKVNPNDETVPQVQNCQFHPVYTCRR